MTDLRMTGHGYEYVSPHPQGEGERPVYLHRLNAVAWGLLDGYTDPREVHHAAVEADTMDSGVPWDNRESTLEALCPVEHGRRSGTEGQRRRRQEAEQARPVAAESPAHAQDRQPARADGGRPGTTHEP